MRKRHEQKLLIMAVLLLMAFNMPLMLLFDSADAVGGVPLMYVYFFSVWGLSILVTLYIIKRYYE